MKKILTAIALCCSIAAYAGTVTNAIFINIDPSYEGEPPGVYITTNNSVDRIYSPGSKDVGIIKTGTITIYSIPDGTHCFPNSNCQWSLPQSCVDMINKPDRYNAPVVIQGYINPDISLGIITLQQITCSYQYQ